MGKHQLFVEKKRVARSFLKGLNTYDQAAEAQKRVNHRLLTILQQFNLQPGCRLMEVGCCTGLLTELISRKLEPQSLYLNDLVPEFIEPVREKLGETASERIVPFFGDIETIQFPENLDIIISSSAFQWLSDLDGFFRKAAESLRHHGMVAFSMFGEGTFHELSTLIGTGLEYRSFSTIVNLLDSHFSVVLGKVERDRLLFNSPKEVLRHIQETGVSGVGGYQWTPQRLREFQKNYIETFAIEEHVPLSYVSYYFIAQKR